MMMIGQNKAKRLIFSIDTPIPSTFDIYSI
jgi:hypothetical protein